MKMRSLLCVLVALILAMSMMLVSCGDDTTETDPVESTPQTNTNPEADKQLIANAFPGFSLEGIFDEIKGMIPEEGVNLEFDLDAVMDSLMEAAKGIVAEGDFTVTQDGQSLTAYMGIKDGIINMDMMGQDRFIALDKKGFASIESLGGSSFVEFENIEMPEIPEMPEMSVDEIKALIDEYIPVEVQQIIEGFTFPALSTDDIVLDGDYYVISDEYYKSISDEVLTLVKDIMAVMVPDEAPTQEEFDETLADVDALIDALGIKIGFAVAGQNIVAVRFEVDADVAAIDDMFGPKVEVENGGNEFIEMSADTAASDKLYAAFEIKLSSDATKLESAGLDFEACMDGETVTADYDFVISYNGNMPVKVNNDMAINVPFENMEFKVSQEYAFSYEGEVVTKMDYAQSISVKNGLDDNIEMNAEASIAPNYDAQGMITGMDMDAVITVNDVEQYQEYCQITGKDYGADVYTLGDMKVEIAAELDMANVGASNAKIAGLDVNVSYTPESIYYYEDYTYEKGTDISALEDAPTMSDCTMNIEIAFAVMSVGENKCKFTVLGSENGETMLDAEGNLTIGTADGMEETPAIVEIIYADGFAGVYAELESMGEYMLKNSAYYTYYFDDESGLYVYVTYSNIYIGDVAPDSAELINRYGEFERFGLNG